MVDEKQRQNLEWKLRDLAFEFQNVPVEVAAEMLRMEWQFGPELHEHILRGNIKKPEQGDTNGKGYEHRNGTE